MFDNLMQNLFLNTQNKIEEEKKVLEEKIIEYSSADDYIKIKLNANIKVLDISISPNIISEDKEMLEDFLVVNFNKAIELANKAREEQLESIKTEMMPDINDILGSFSDDFDDDNFDDNDDEIIQ
ncbi:MAG: YbaB/EbfC family nucleoid-associated protein [Bacteroidales bacterium]|nr:YbaB/EbfC family nucleoid-associated protein [Bacteroidales bacterium]